MHDHLLVRSHGDDEGFNLSVGEPFFLQDAFKYLIDAVEPLTSVTYPILGGDAGLIREAVSYMGPHARKHTVVANGAKQALLALAYAHRKLRFNALSAEQPYWLSYPTIAKLSDLTFNPDPDNIVMTVATSPNNPDGSIYRGKVTVWDAAYMSPVYLNDPAEMSKGPDHQCSVWSAAKLLGVSGLRVGWLTTEDEEVAKLAAQYVEITTSGVCTYAQQHVAGILRDLARFGRPFWDKARGMLVENAQIFNALTTPYCEEVRGLPSNGNGMFAFFKPKDQERFKKAMESAKVRLVPGVACGAQYEGWYRMSLGQRSGFLRTALTALKERLDEND